MSIELVDSSGYEYMFSVAARFNKNHSKHLNYNVVLPMMHAAVVANVVRGGRRYPFAPLSKGYSKFKEKQTDSRASNRQPHHLGRQRTPSRRILVASGKFFNNLGTENYVTERGAFYGIDESQVPYADDIIRGRGAGTQMVTIPEHIRSGHIRKLKSGKSVQVRPAVVAEKKKYMNAGAIPGRNPFYLLKSDIETIENLFENYYTVDIKQKSVSIQTNLPFTASKRIQILNSSGKGAGRRILKKLT